MTSLFINNQWQNGHGDSFSSLNPANQEVVWQGEAANAHDVDFAINSANLAFKNWSLLSVQQRCNYIEKYINLLEESKEQYAETINQENGKPLWEARTEVTGMIAKYKASLNSYNTRTGETESLSAVSSRLVHRPIGVMIVFGPFNFPGHLPNGHIIPALIAGNTCVFKPSELTPKCAELMVKLWQQADLPAGVLNLVQGGSEVGKALVANQKINGVLFTGSYKVGKMIHQALSGRPEVMLALEMGGNNPLIVDTDITNINAAVYHTIQSAFVTAGQRCTCARRLYVPEGTMGDKFIAKLVDVTNHIAVSDGVNFINMGSNKDPFIGPVISLCAKQSVLDHQEKLLNNYKSEALITAKSIAKNSALVTPGIIAMYEQDVSDQECFGPLLQVYRYNNFKQAIEQANNTAYGLSAGLLSDNKENFDLFYKLIRAGIVNWNKPTTGAAGTLPFGGIGHSGNYRPSAAYAADYCAYPMATQFSEIVELPEGLTPGVKL